MILFRELYSPELLPDLCTIFRTSVKALRISVKVNLGQGIRLLFKAVRKPARRLLEIV